MWCTGDGMTAGPLKHLANHVALDAVWPGLSTPAENCTTELLVSLKKCGLAPPGSRPTQAHLPTSQHSEPHRSRPAFTLFFQLMGPRSSGCLLLVSHFPNKGPLCF